MLRFLVRRVSSMGATLAAVSMVVFFIIELPPGDYAASAVNAKLGSGDEVLDEEEEIARIRRLYGLDRPLPVRCWNWVKGFPRGDFGLSFKYKIPVAEVISDKFGFTAFLAILSLILTYGLGVPLGVFCALRQYSPGDYVLSTLAYIGLAVPSFMLALIILYFSVTVFGASVGGLFSPEYVTAARARGISGRRLLLGYPVRSAMNPIVSTIGWELSTIVSGSAIVAIVLAVPDMGFFLVDALLSQDMYLAGTLLLLISLLTIIGTFISDVLLAVMDPRIRLGRG